MANASSQRGTSGGRCGPPPSPFRRVVDETFATFWSITSIFGTHDRDNFYYGRFSVVIVSLAQLVIILACWGAAFGDLADWIGKPAVKIICIALAITLAALNSMVMYRIDDRLRRQRRRFRYRPLPVLILGLFFASAVYCVAYLFG